MQTFSLGFISRTHLVLFIVGGLLFFGVVIGLFSYYTEWGVLFELLAIPAVFYLFYKASGFSRQQASFSITEDNLQMEWGKGPWLTSKKDQQVAWSNIATYKLEPARLFDVFELKLHTGEKLAFSISKLNDQEGRFREFYRAFLAKVESLEQANTKGKSINIQKAKTFYDTTFGIVFILAAGLFLIGLFLYELYTFFFN